MSKWTPGPWEAVIPDGPHIYEGTDISNFRIHSASSYHDSAKIDNKTIVSGQYMDDIGHEESAANARLIAAAPEMAELLAETVEVGAYGIGSTLAERIIALLERINK